MLYVCVTGSLCIANCVFKNALVPKKTKNNNNTSQVKMNFDQGNISTSSANVN